MCMKTPASYTSDKGQGSNNWFRGLMGGYAQFTADEASLGPASV